MNTLKKTHRLAPKGLADVHFYEFRSLTDGSVASLVRKYFQQCGGVTR